MNQMKQKVVPLPPAAPESERILMGAVPQWPNGRSFHVEHLKKAAARVFYRLVRKALLKAISTLKLRCGKKVSLLVDKLDFKLDNLK